MNGKSIRISDLENGLKRCPQAVAAAVLGLDVRTVRERIKSGEYPDAGQGRTDLFDAARVERHKQREGPGPSARTKLHEIQTKQRELDYRRRAGELFERDEVSEAVSLALLTIRASALAMASRVAPLVCPDDPAYAAGVLKDEIAEFLNDASSKLASLGSDPIPVPDPPSASRKTTRRVGKRKKKAAKRKRRGRKV